MYYFAQSSSISSKQVNLWCLLLNYIGSFGDDVPCQLLVSTNYDSHTYRPILALLIYRGSARNTFSFCLTETTGPCRGGYCKIDATGYSCLSFDCGTGNYLEVCQSEFYSLFYHINKLYIISKCIDLYEMCHTSVKRSFLILIKF